MTLNGSETIVVRASAADRFEVEATYAPHGSRPPKHVHPHHDEFFTVLAGDLRVGFGSKVRDFRAGESFEIPRGTVHHMWNRTGEPCTVRWTSTPADRVESFFVAMDRLHHSGRDGRIRRAGLVGLAGVLSDHRDVMRPASAFTRGLVRMLAPFARRDAGDALHQHPGDQANITRSGASSV